MTSARTLLTTALLALAVGGAAGFYAARRTGPAAAEAGPGPGEIMSFHPERLGVAEKRPSAAAIAQEISELGYGRSAEAPSSGRGVTLHDPARSQPGWNLIVPGHEPLAVVIDAGGAVLHEWRFPYRDVPGARKNDLGNWRRVRVLPDGGLLGVYEGFGMVRLDRDSRLVWFAPGNYHHELDLTQDGRLYVLGRRFEILPRFRSEAQTVEDSIVELSLADGRELRRVSLVASFESSPYAPFLQDAQRGGDIFHANALKLLDGSLAARSPLFARGKALISLRHMSAVAIVDLERERVDWMLAGLWHMQHDPTLLPDGHLLVFDNQTTETTSSVIEIDPFTQEVLWAYRGDASNDFYSRLCGSCQRLPNGNTLITESSRGRVFEVTRAGEVVWRYESEYHVGDDPEDVAVLFDVVRFCGEPPLAWLASGPRDSSR